MQRTILLKQRLTPNKADRAQIMAVGDAHYGHHTCDEEAFRERLSYALQHKMYVLTMGDLLEACLKDSKGDAYDQKVKPEKQMEDMVSMLEPLASVGLLLGMIHGN